MEALTDEASHVVIYGERGRGKTSLANSAVERLRRRGTIVGRYVCNANSTFEQIITGALRDLPTSLLSFNHTGQQPQASSGCESLLPKADMQLSDVANMPNRLSCKQLVFVIDEFDRVEDRGTRKRLADMIKLLSDRGVRLHFMILGVSSTLEDLIGQHSSIQRNITGVHLPLLESSEIATLLKTGAESAGLRFSEEACAIVTAVARGMPYMAQLMGLRIVQQTLSRGATETSREDIAAAIERLLGDTSQEIANRYAVLTSGPNGEAIRAALEQIVTAPQDRWGRSMPSGIEQNLLDRLLDEQILEKCNGLPDLLQPTDRRLVNYVLLLSAQRSLAPSVAIRQMSMAQG
jgi:hypothetical protein